MAVTESGDFVRPVAAVTHENEGAVGEAYQEQSQQAAHQLSRSAVRTLLLLVQLGATVEIDEDRQCPATGGEWELPRGQPRRTTCARTARR